MAQLADVLVVILLLLAVTRQFPQIRALLGQVRPHSAAAPRSPEAMHERRTIELVLCAQCGTASPLAARFCDRCGSRLPRYTR